uniref:Zinc transporter ZIP9 n=1 Tax=Strigamia maritima TaxID=126957 RepID=T1JMB8_STRMM
MGETLVLILLSLAMLVGCYVFGIIPLICNLSEEKLQITSVLGAGLLVGTALAVIIPEGVNTLYSTQRVSNVAEQKGAHVASNLTQAHVHSNLHNQIGMALVLGFVFMLIVDQIGGGHGRSQDAESGIGKDRTKITATLGLVVHAAADGVALGAAATTSHTDVEMIVFIAIMLHKAPAAFGLVTFLLHAGLDRSRIKRHLLIFALSAPVLAIVTYFGISQERKETLSTMNATGFAMLFSAGTFLYVATVHVLPEIILRSQHHGSTSSDSSKTFQKKELFTLILGATAPLLLAIGHHH